MAGFTDILGSLIQNGMSKSGMTRMNNGFGGSSQGSLNDIIGNFGKMLGSGQPGRQPSAQTDASRSGSGLESMIGSVLQGLGSNKAALGGIGALGGALLGGGSKSAKGALGGGALAMLASLAFSALKKSGQAPAEPPKALFEPESDTQIQELQDDARILVKAMIGAAKADGSIDQQELKKIAGKLEEDGLTKEETTFFRTEAEKPLNIEEITSIPSYRSDLAAQIYAASLLAIEVDTQAEQQYMTRLAQQLNLAPQTVEYIETTLHK